MQNIQFPKGGIGDIAFWGKDKIYSKFLQKQTKWTTSFCTITYSTELCGEWGFGLVTKAFTT